MVFKKNIANNISVESPEALFADLRNRTVEGLLSQQADMLREYLRNETYPDIALELPTGSGKTLVGLLIAEWRRRKYREKCLFLCPTVQLVNQVAEQAQEKYGIKAIKFVGKKSDYCSTEISRYENSEAIGITTYSSLFNSNPFFNDSSVLIFDDAHAAENYVSVCWSIEISRSSDTQLFNYIKGLIYPFIEENDQLRFNNYENENIDLQFVNKLPTPLFLKIRKELSQILINYCNNGSNKFRWDMIQNNLHACHLYFTANKFLLRPIIPPTESFEPFRNAKQRVYMSATLGDGGELERIFGREKIKRIPAPVNFEKQGIGRRFFVFPMRVWDEETAINKAISWIEKVPRALILCPKDKDIKKIKELINLNGEVRKYEFFDAQEIEKSKKSFVQKDKAVSILANRYDGIDLSGDECRYLILYELPEATNLQEKFLISRMKSPSLFHERIKTRIIQAVGRCTRSSTDWALVCVIGNKINKYFMNPEKRKIFPVELQAEIEFGIEQSSIENVDTENISENIDIFLSQNEDWGCANEDIINMRNSCTREPVKDIEILTKIVGLEIQYMNCIWNKDYETALSNALNICSQLTSDELRGYKCWWLYLAGNAATLVKNAEKANELYKKASKTVKGISWLQNLRVENELQYSKETIEDVDLMLEKISEQFSEMGYIENNKFQKIKKRILENLNQKTASLFEQGQVELGKFLGFDAHNSDVSGAPDPFWVMSANKGIVFEDYTNTKESTQKIPKKKVDQINGHEEHIKYNYPAYKYVDFKGIICSDVNELELSACPHVRDAYFISVDDFRMFANDALSFLEDLWTNYSEDSINWKEISFQKCIDASFTPSKIIERLTRTKLKELDRNKV